MNKLMKYRNDLQPYSKPSSLQLTDAMSNSRTSLMYVGKQVMKRLTPKFEQKFVTMSPRITLEVKIFLQGIF